MQPYVVESSQRTGAPCSPQPPQPVRAMSEAPFQLYGRPNAGSLAVQIVLEEIGAPYQLRWVDTTTEALEAYRRINHAGKVPALVLPDGTAVCESAAILTYLASAYPAAQLAPAAGSPAHARFLQWMVSLSANMYETALRYYYAERYSTAGAAAQVGIQERALQNYLGHLEVVHEALAPYVLGSAYSAADPYLYMLSGWYPGERAALHERLPKLARHSALLRERAATLKADADHAEKAPSS
jgi:glutathione S-transferase